ncbi:MAG: hypothetical protein GDA54_06495 [Alphaproteobacteria bacterium GM7ARS4]|nr:hypothetical protein [Alphaproteobacteria bacterium GM7ARS4]
MKLPFTSRREKTHENRSSIEKQKDVGLSKGADAKKIRPLLGKTLGRSHLLRGVAVKGRKTIEHIQDWRDAKPKGQSISYRTLLRLHKSHSAQFPDNLAHRMRRALSWIRCAEKAYAADKGNQDSFFMFYWIAFNAAYAQRTNPAAAQRANESAPRERDIFHEFLRRIIDLDKEHAIYNVIWDNFPLIIREILDNEYVFKWFWYDQYGDNAHDRWEESFQRSKRRAHHALNSRDTKTIAQILFDRLYELRNQLMHGCATWKGGVNRPQVEQGAKIMAAIVPLILKTMMENHREDWKRPPCLMHHYTAT